MLSLEDIPMNSVWMAADGGSYGHYVTGKIPLTNEIIVKPFSAKGWSDDGLMTIDAFKLQYRYFQVA